MPQQVASVHPESLRLRRLRRMSFGAGIHERGTPRPTRENRDLGETTILELPNDWDIHDQGERGACVAHAAVACLEYFVFKQTRRLTSFSEQFVHFNMRKLQKEQGIVSDRTWLSEARDVLQTSGICLQSECLYDPFVGPLGLDGAEPSSSARSSAEHHRFESRVVDHPEDHGIIPSEFIVESLHNGYPVAVSIPVQVLRSSFGVTNWTTRLGRFHGIVADPDGDCPDGHAVCIVGYLRDPRGAGGGWFVCRNSWGLEWASEAFSDQPFAIKDLPGRGYGVMSAKYIDTLCSEIFTIAGRI
jgi:C1A family cysteine protease